MKKINKLLILFLVMTTVMIYGGWIFIHSKKFSEEASLRFSKLLTEKMGVSLRFEQVDFGVFPPSTTFKRVRIQKNQKDKFDFDFNVKELTIKFTYASFLASRPEVDELIVQNGYLKLNVPDDEPFDFHSININKYFKMYEDHYVKGPLFLSYVQMRKLDIRYNKVEGHVESLSLKPLKKSLALNLDASDVIDERKVKINQVNLQGVMTKNEIKLLDLTLNSAPLYVKMDGALEEKNNKLLVTTFFKAKSNILEIKKLPFKLPPEFNKIEGQLDVQGEIKSDLFNPDFKIVIWGKQVKTPWIIFDDVTASLTKKKQMLSCLAFKGKKGREEYQLIRPATFFDLSKKVFLKTSGNFELKEAETNNFLSVISDTLGPLKANITGEVEISWNGEKVLFTLKNKVVAKKFALLFPKSKTPLLKNEGFVFENTKITLDKNLNVGLVGHLLMPHSLFNFDGVITEKEINLKVVDSRIDLTSFGAISGVGLNGQGPFNLNIHGPFDKVVFDFDVDWKNFSVVDLNFGEVKSKFSLDLEDVKINIEKLDGVFNQTHFVSSGYLQFGDHSGLDLKLKFPSTTLKDAKGMYRLIFDRLSFPKDMDLNFETTYRVFGDYDLKDLKVEGALKGKEVHFLGEEADHLSFNFNLNNKVLQFKDLKLKKSRGEITGKASIMLANNYTEVEASGGGIRLSDFNFYKLLKLDYDSDLKIDFDGNGMAENFSSRLRFKTKDPFISNYPASATFGVIDLGRHDVKANIHLLGDKIHLVAGYNFDNENMLLKSTVDTYDLREILGAISGHNMNDRSIKGNIKASLETMFHVPTFLISQFNLKVDELQFKRDEIDLKIDSKRNSILVENGIVKNWDLRFFDNKEYFLSVGKNINDNKSIVCDQSFSIKTSAFELISNGIEKAHGIMSGTGQVLLDKKLTIASFNLIAKNNSLKLRKVPGKISDLDFSINKNGDKFELDHFKGKFGEGDITATGQVVFDSLIPQLNFDFKMDKATVQLFKKSTLLVSGSGSLKGKEFPYLLSGRLQVLRGEINDGPAEIMADDQVSIDDLHQYLPQKENTSLNMAVMDVQLETLDYVSVKNSMAEVYLKAAGNISGSVFSPAVNARVDVQPLQSKLKFKGHDFILNQGYVEVHDKDKQRASELKVVGLAKVNDYDIKLDISGSLKKTDLLLTCDKLASKDEILSLLITGTTHEINRSLTKQDQASVATVSVATTLSEVLGFNQSLNSALGLNLSIAPEFEEDSGSLASTGKTGIGEGLTSKLKSATKIKIKKEINKSVDVSLSSTVGGSIEQKQEMNLNWNINKKMSLEGVYEIKPAEEENNSTPNSIGADLKFKWNF